MSKKLEGNGLWESSRLMLPQHKEVIVNDDLRHVKKTSPVLDEQEMEQIEHALIRSFRERRKVTLDIFDLYEKVQVVGIVTTINSVNKEIKLAIDTEEWKWLYVEDIMSATIS